MVQMCREKAELLETFETFLKQNWNLPSCLVAGVTAVNWSTIANAAIKITILLIVVARFFSQKKPAQLRSEIKSVVMVWRHNTVNDAACARQGSESWSQAPACFLTENTLFLVFGNWFRFLQNWREKKIMLKMKSHGISLRLCNSINSLLFYFYFLNIFFRECFIPRYIGLNMDMVKLHSMEDMMSLPVTSWNIQQPAGEF